MIFILGCGDDPAGPQPTPYTVSLTVSKLPHLEHDDGHYELWISFPEETGNLAKPAHGDEAFVSFGKFNMSEDGTTIIDLDGTPMVFETGEPVDINVAADAIVTIEREEGGEDHSHEESQEPGSRLMAGVFTGTDKVATASLTPADDDAFGFDYSTTAGVYILDTPTSTASDDFNSGIWWLDQSGGAQALTPGITQLPALTDTSGWQYEGWVIDKSGATPVFYSTGRFLEADDFDSDKAGLTAGPDGDADGDGLGDGPMFPGQDFVRAHQSIPALLPLNNGNFEARLTLEPEPDNSSGPFLLVILADETIDSNIASSFEKQSMNNRVASTFPSATVRIDR